MSSPFKRESLLVSDIWAGLYMLVGFTTVNDYPTALLMRIDKDNPEPISYVDYNLQPTLSFNIDMLPVYFKVISDIFVREE